MISSLAKIEIPLGEHLEKVLYFLKLIYPISLLMLVFFVLGLYFAYLLWSRFAKRLHRSFEESRAVMNRMSALTTDQDDLLASIESQFDKERNDWAAKVDNRDHELAIYGEKLSEAELVSVNLQSALSERETALHNFEEQFNSVVHGKDSEIGNLGIELSKTAGLRKELSEQAHIIVDLRIELKSKNHLAERLLQLEGILETRELQIKELREKLGLR